MDEHTVHGRISTHGLQQATDSDRSLLNKIAWVGVFLVFFALFTYGAWAQLQRVISMPVSVDITVSLEERVFPTITFCNLNPFRKSMLAYYQTANLLLAAADPSATSLGRRRRSADGRSTASETSLAVRAENVQQMTPITAHYRRKRQEAPATCTLTSPVQFPFNGFNGGACGSYLALYQPTTCFFTNQFIMYSSAAKTSLCTTATHSCVPGCYYTNPSTTPFFLPVTSWNSHLYAQVCFDYCSANGFTIVGLMGGHLCACGTTFVSSTPVPMPLVNCSGPCAGDASMLYCGSDLYPGTLNAGTITIFCVGCPINVTAPSYAAYNFSNTVQNTIDMSQYGYVSNGATATLICVGPQYVLDPPNPAAATCTNGAWSQFPPPGQCLAPCSAYTSADPNAIVTYSDPTYMTYNSTVIVSCPAGYVLVGATQSVAHFVCSIVETWAPINGANPSCQVVTTSTSTSTTTSSTSTTTSSTTTMSTTTTAPQAIPGQCPPFTVKNGVATSYSNPKLGPGTAVRWMCDAGYIATGDAVLTCGGDWTWQFVVAPPDCSWPYGGVSPIGGPAAAGGSGPDVGSTLGLLPNYTQAELVAIGNFTLGPGGQLANLATAAAMLQYLLSSLSPAELQQLGHQEQGTVIDCMFNEQLCAIGDVAPIMEDILQTGNCYSFNNEQMRKLYNATAPGEEHGLFLALNVQQSEYLSTTIEAGMRLIVSDLSANVFPASQGLYLVPGMSTSIGLHLVTANQISRPSSRCVNGVADLDPSMPYYYASTAYDSEACIRSLLQSAIIRQCGCATPHYAAPTTGVSFCDVTQMGCVVNFTHTNAATVADEAAQKCPEACIVNEYVATSSMAPLTPSLVAQFCPPFMEIPNCEQTFMSNSLTVRVYFQTLWHTTLTEYVTFEMTDFVSGLGGTMSLLAGMSIISVLELAFLLFKALSSCLFRRRHIDTSLSAQSHQPRAKKLIIIRIRDAGAQTLDSGEDMNALV